MASATGVVFDVRSVDWITKITKHILHIVPNFHQWYSIARNSHSTTSLTTVSLRIKIWAMRSLCESCTGPGLAMLHFSDFEVGTKASESGRSNTASLWERSRPLPPVLCANSSHSQSRILGKSGRRNPDLMMPLCAEFTWCLIDSLPQALYDDWCQNPRLTVSWT